MSKVAIFNMAISSTGGQAVLSSPDEDTIAAEQCRLWYVTARDFIFKKTYWPVIKKSARLVVVAENDFSDDWTEADPPLPWRFAYAAPNEMLNVQYLFSIKETNYPQRYQFDEFELGRHNNAKVIFTQLEYAGAQYSMVNDNSGEWQENLRLAVAMQLGALIAPALGTKTSQIALIEQRMDKYVMDCHTQVANEAEIQFLQEPNAILDSRTDRSAYRLIGDKLIFYPEALS